MKRWEIHDSLYKLTKEKIMTEPTAKTQAKHASYSASRRMDRGIPIKLYGINRRADEPIDMDAFEHKIQFSEQCGIC